MKAHEWTEMTTRRWAFSIMVGLGVSLVAQMPAVSSAQTVSFGPATHLAAGVLTNAVGTGDFNQDGIPDVAVATSCGGNIGIFLGTGTGSFGSVTTVAAGTSCQGRGIVVADFNRDGRDDLAVTSNVTAGTVAILLGTGPGSFGTPSSFSVAAANPHGIANGDFNRDGRLDLVTANINGNNVSVLLGNGSGGFGAANTFATGIAPVAVAIGDFNRDGIPDLATANDNSRNVSVLIGDGTGAFGPATNLPLSAPPNSVAIGDFNRDGNMDIVTGHSLGITVFFGNGAGGFGPATNISVAGGAGSIASFDLNGDGFLDLAGLAAGQTIVVLEGTGSGAFSSPQTIGTAGGFPGGAPESIAIADVNRDGKPDLLSANGILNSDVSILLNTTAFTPAGSFGTRRDLISGTNPFQAAIGDINRDGILDLAVISEAAGTLTVHLGNGDGSFGVGTIFTGFGSVRSVIIADFNRDGIPDIAVSRLGSANAVSILLGTGNASLLGPATSFAAGGNSDQLAVGDFNRDGILDLAVSDCGVSATRVLILLGTGTSSLFGPATGFIAGTQLCSLAVGDLNRDGILDVAATNSNTGSVSVLLGTGDGSLGPPTFFAAGTNPFPVAIGDFNRNGIPDLAVANTGPGTVSILLGTGTSALFGTDTEFAVQSNPRNIAIADLNRDGILDLAVANAGTFGPGDSVSILLGTGTGTFQAATNLPMGGGVTRYVTSGDVNRDGKPDLVVAQGNVISILINTAPGPPNTPPVSASQSVSTNENTAKVITLSASDADSPSLTFAVAAGPLHGTLSTITGRLCVSAGGTNCSALITYTPAANYNGPDSFMFAASDGSLTSAPATVSITVTAVNNAPSFTIGPNQTVTEDAGARTVNSFATNILAGPANETGQLLTFLVTNNTSGLFSIQPAISPAGTLTYTLAPNAFGSATVTVRLKDNGGTANGGVDTSAAQIFTITVTGVNDPPVALSQSVANRKDANGDYINIPITLTATDVDSASLTFAIATNPTTGGSSLSPLSAATCTSSTTIAGTGSSCSATVTYQLNPAFFASTPRDSFTFTVSDGSRTSTGTVSIGSIIGMATDSAGQPLGYVVIENTADGFVTYTDAAGRFLLPVSGTSFTLNALAPFRCASGTTSGDLGPASVTIVLNANPSLTPRPGLRNGGFEAGDFTCWTPTPPAAGSIVQQLAAVGVTGGQIVPKEADRMAKLTRSGTPGTSTTFTQRLKVPKGAQALRFAYNFVAGTGAIDAQNTNDTVRAEILAASSPLPFTDTFGAGAHGTWREGSLNVAALGGTDEVVTLKFTLQNLDDNNAGNETSLLLDNIRFATVVVDAKIITGALGAPADAARVQDEVRNANVLLSQAGINVRIRRIVAVNSVQSFIGPFSSCTSSTPATTDLIALLNLNTESNLAALSPSTLFSDPTLNGIANPVNLYFVQALGTLAGFAVGPDDYLMNAPLTESGIFLANPISNPNIRYRPSEILAHELGHLLIHPDCATRALEHNVTEGANLMKQPLGGTRANVSADQGDHIHTGGNAVIPIPSPWLLP